MSTLDVYFQETPCARLNQNPDGVLQLQYRASWIDSGGMPVSTRLPVRELAYGHAEVAPFVASFLPEGDSLRQRLEKLLHIEASHDFGLLSVIGRESAGALSFWPEHEEPFQERPGYEALTDRDFEAWREFAHQLPLQFVGKDIRLSLAGAQSKTALYFDQEDRAFLPEHGAPTTHILKPRIRGCQPSTAYVELLTMRLAHAVLGAERVPNTDLWKNCYRIRRFDRLRNDAGITRRHQEDFCLALGRMPSQKYETVNPRERLLGPCFRLIDDLGERGLIQSPALQRLHLLDQVIINALLHNPDAHLKNYAFLYQEDGTLEVSPLYDCLCTHGLGFSLGDGGAWVTDAGPATHTRDLSLQIGNAVAIDQITLEDWELFALECGFTQAFVRRRVKLMAQIIETELRPVVESTVAGIPSAERAGQAFFAGVSGQIVGVLGSG